MRTTKTTVLSFVFGAAALAAAALPAVQSQAGDTVQLPGIDLTRRAPLKCQESSLTEFPRAVITNVSASTIPQGKVIAYKISGDKSTYQMKLAADLPSMGAVYSSVSNEPGFKCTAKLL